MLPAITCLLEAKRPLASIKKSIASYRAQGYTNKELVVVAGADTFVFDALRRYLQAQDWTDVRLMSSDQFERSGSPDGDLMAFWSDDTLSHPDRLTEQVGFLQLEKRAACRLADHWYFLWQERELYWCDAGENIDSLLVERADWDRLPLRTADLEAAFRQCLGDTSVALLHNRGFLLVKIENGWGATVQAASRDNIERHSKDERFIAQHRGGLESALNNYPLAHPLLMYVRNHADQIVALW